MMGATVIDPVAVLIFGSKTVLPTTEMITAELASRFQVDPHAVKVLIYKADKGVGAAAENWGKFYDVMMERHKPDFADFGGHYAPKRCHRIMAASLEKHANKVAIGFWDAFSDGACDMAARLLVRHIPVQIVPCDPRRIPAERRPPPANWGSEEWMKQQNKRKR